MERSRGHVRIQTPKVTALQSAALPEGCMSTVAIADHALLSDRHSAALVTRDGSVDWLCLPRFDSSSVFGRLLGDEAGHWSINAVGAESVSRRYLDRTMVLETDPFGNFLAQGYEFASARDWARLGNLYLQDGVRNQERILPEGFVKFVSTPAPAWVADHNPVYGGFFWINGDGSYPVQRSAYFMSGAGGQKTMFIPSHDLVVVRLGHFN